ncbi:hypothetical protein [Sediminicurvatus halobius]|uniref:hypothetical protein n=1 Tax=Sediminicurvatus halobius TaxID=2182432 RepID=UPI0011B1DD27|nr:hypothetical protein [Spiribacter halobius]UEX76291.1 hypothetical protein LMH63_09955 [Spiribacter halobius]
MAEIENPKFNKNHSLDLKPMRLDVYRLACQFEGSGPLSDEREDLSVDMHQALKDLEKEFFCDEASRILLQSATIIRMLDDESEADSDEKNPFFCGFLQTADKEERLSLREACNKIIHARKINFDQSLEEGTQGCFGPYVYLYGTRSRTDWKATLYIRQFLAYAGQLLRARSLAEFLEWEKRYGCA